jgi:glycosyltransferase involved in cell wall biosynthesis
VSENLRRPKVFMMDLWATVPYYTAYLSRALSRENVNLTIGSISYYLDATCFSSRGIKLDPGILDAVGKFRLPRLPRRILKLLESILNLCALTFRFLITPPEIIHVQYLPMVFARLPFDLWFVRLFRKRGVKIILTVHDLVPHDTGEAHKQTCKDLYQMVDGIICHSDNVKTRLGAEFAVPEEKITVIPHGPFFYDLPATETNQTLQSFDLEPGKLLVLWQGIIFPYKGIDLLLNAWQQVEAHNDDARLLIVGTGAPEFAEQIRDQISRLSLRHATLHLRFISTEELVALYRAADVVVYPYRAITTSGALATGLALGKAIIASNLPVFRELLTDRKNALLVDPQDAATLAAALTELSSDFALRQQLAANVQAMDFGDRSWLSIAKKTRDFFVDFLSPLV